MENLKKTKVKKCTHKNKDGMDATYQFELESGFGYPSSTYRRCEICRAAWYDDKAN